MKTLRILIDTREQRPLVFPTTHKDYTIETVRATLPAGDYSIEGWGGEAEGARFGIAIERKHDHDEIAGNLGEHRDRFEAEMLRLAGYQTAVIVIAQPRDAIHNAKLRTRMTAASLDGSILGFAEKFRIPVVWEKNEDAAAHYVLNALRRFHERMSSPRAGVAGGTRSLEKHPPAIIDKYRWANLIGRVARLETLANNLLATMDPTVPPLRGGDFSEEGQEP